MSEKGELKAKVTTRLKKYDSKEDRKEDDLADVETNTETINLGGKINESS